MSLNGTVHFLACNGEAGNKKLLWLRMLREESHLHDEIVKLFLGDTDISLGKVLFKDWAGRIVRRVGRTGTRRIDTCRHCECGLRDSVSIL